MAIIYNPTEWIDNETLLNAEQLNHIESGLVKVKDEVNNVRNDITKGHIGSTIFRDADLDDDKLHNLFANVDLSPNKGGEELHCPIMNNGPTDCHSSIFTFVPNVYWGTCYQLLFFDGVIWYRHGINLLPVKWRDWEKLNRDRVSEKVNLTISEENIALINSVNGSAEDNSKTFANKSWYIIKDGICYLYIGLEHYKYPNKIISFEEILPKPYSEFWHNIIADGLGANLVVSVTKGGKCNVYNGSGQSVGNKYYQMISYPIAEN